jgi:hypothetical protein
MYNVKFKNTEYFLESAKQIKNESLSHKQDRLVKRKELATKYSLQLAQFLARQYKEFDAIVVKV